MKRNVLTIVTITLAFIIGMPLFGQNDSQADSLQIRHKYHKHPFPLNIDSVYLNGRTRDRDIKKIHGEGVFDSTDGHLGARYFIDIKGKALLKTTIGVDGFIEEVALSEIEYPFDFVTSIITYPDNAISSNFSIFSKTENNFKLGQPEKIIVNSMGIPNRIIKFNELKTLIYEDSNNEWNEVIFYQATFVFRKNKLIRMTIYCGE